MKEQRTFNSKIIIYILALIVLGAIASWLLNTHSDGGKKQVIDNTINKLLAVSRNDPNIKVRHEMGCTQVGQSPFDKGHAHCRQMIDLLFRATENDALDILTEKQRMVESELHSLMYTREYGARPKRFQSGSIGNDYNTNYIHKTGVNCSVDVSFPANETEVMYLYPDFQNLAVIRLDCGVLVDRYFYPAY